MSRDFSVPFSSGRGDRIKFTMIKRGGRLALSLSHTVQEMEALGSPPPGIRVRVSARVTTTVGSYLEGSRPLWLAFPKVFVPGIRVRVSARVTPRVARGVPPFLQYFFVPPFRHFPKVQPHLCCFLSLLRLAGHSFLYKNITSVGSS